MKRKVQAATGRSALSEWSDGTRGSKNEASTASTLAGRRLQHWYRIWSSSQRKKKNSRKRMGAADSAPTAPGTPLATGVAVGCNLLLLVLVDLAVVEEVLVVEVVEVEVAVAVGVAVYSNRTRTSCSQPNPDIFRRR
jgi:hypothetical protein